jgi:hypothetical protein
VCGEANQCVAIGVSCVNWNQLHVLAIQVNGEPARHRSPQEAGVIAVHVGVDEEANRPV